MKTIPQINTFKLKILGKSNLSSKKRKANIPINFRQTVEIKPNSKFKSLEGYDYIIKKIIYPHEQKMYSPFRGITLEVESI